MNLAPTPVPIADLKLKAFEILCRELGLLEAGRLFRELGLVSGDYTKDRAKFADMTEEEMDEAITKFRAEAAARWKA